MKVASLIALFSFSIIVHSAPFQNLDFEMANTNSLTRTPGFVFDYEGPTADLLPGWQLLFGAQPLTTIGFNLEGDPLSVKHVTMISSENPKHFIPLPPIEGKYSVYLDANVPGPFEFSIVQRGDIPADAQLLEFTFRQLPFAVSVNGQNLSPPIQNGAPFPSGDKTFVDISQFAGQNVELKFTTSAGSFGPSGPDEIDAIGFVVPEPSVLTLVCVGGACWLCLAICRHARHNRLPSR